MDSAQEYKLDIRSASNTNAPLFLKEAHQKYQRIDPTSTDNPTANLSNNTFNNAIFDNVSVKKYYAEIDGFRYPNYPNYRESSYLNQYSEGKLF